MSDENLDNTSELEEESKKAQPVKVKLQMSLNPDHPLADCFLSLKDRGVKSPDLNRLVEKALEEVPEAWWNERIEEAVPLDIKVQEALKNPEMREKLNSLFSEATTKH